MTQDQHLQHKKTGDCCIFQTPAGWILSPLTTVISDCPPSGHSVSIDSIDWLIVALRRTPQGYSDLMVDAEENKNRKKKTMERTKGKVY